MFVVKGMEDVIIKWRKIQAVRWVVHCLSANSSYGIRGHLKPAIVLDELYTFAITQY